MPFRRIASRQCRPLQWVTDAITNDFWAKIYLLFLRPWQRRFNGKLLSTTNRAWLHCSDENEFNLLPPQSSVCACVCVFMSAQFDCQRCAGDSAKCESIRHTRAHTHDRIYSLRFNTWTNTLSVMCNFTIFCHKFRTENALKLVHGRHSIVRQHFFSSRLFCYCQSPLCGTHYDTSSPPKILIRIGVSMVEFWVSAIVFIWIVFVELKRTRIGRQVLRSQAKRNELTKKTASRSRYITCLNVDGNCETAIRHTWLSFVGGARFTESLQVERFGRLIGHLRAVRWPLCDWKCGSVRAAANNRR